MERTATTTGAHDRLIDERLSRAMGSDLHLVVVGGRPGLADLAVQRVADLERRWSRFLPGSEVSRMNRLAGTPVLVSDETIHLVERAIEAWRITGAAFDPLLLRQLEAAGYDRSFDQLDQLDQLDAGDEPARPQPAAPSMALVAGVDIVISGRTVTVPAGTAFDPGGIGKGLAADLVATEVMAAGAAGVCVNLGGDLRVLGDAPDGDGWTVAVEHPHLAPPIALLGLGEGAVATSTTLRRRWTRQGQARHHLLDPATGHPSASDLELVTVIAPEAWRAEVLAKAVLLRGSLHPFDVVEGEPGVEALAVDDGGRIHTTAGFAAFLGGGTIPTAIAVGLARVAS